MKKFALLLFAGLFILGCGTGHKRPGTCPHRKAAEAAGDEQPADKKLQEEQDSVKSDEAPEPESTGYGTDPGEETQE